MCYVYHLYSKSPDSGNERLKEQNRLFSDNQNVPCSSFSRRRPEKLIPFQERINFWSQLPEMTEKTQPSNGNSRMLWPDLLRIAAMTGIIGYHVLELFPRLRTNVFSGVFTEFCTMVFVFLAGYFSSVQKDRTIRQYYMSRFVSIVLPYLWISLVLLAGKCVKDGVPSNVCLWIGKNLLLGGAAPVLWFVPMISVFFLFAPFWNRIPRTIRLILLGVGFLGTILVGRGKYSELGKNSLYFAFYFAAGMECRISRKTFESFAAKSVPISCVVLILSLTLLPFCHRYCCVTFAKTMVSLVMIGGTIRLASPEDGRRSSAVLSFFDRKGVKETVAKISGCCYTVYLIHNTWIGVVLSPVFRRIPDQFKHLPLFLIMTILSMIVLVVAVLATKRILQFAGIKRTRPILGA